MAAPPSATGEPITDKRQLIDDIARGSKPAADWRIGTEHEKFGYRVADLHPLPYDGEDGIGAILCAMRRFGWEGVYEGDNVVSLTRGRESITLEPGGQFELSGAPLETLHQTCQEVNTHLAEVKEVTSELGTCMLGLGFLPKWKREDISFMPKGRYQIMGNYMPKVGGLGLDMMLRSCTVQVNLDFSDEADMVKKFRVGLALQPVATALFANSPFVEGKPSGYLSFRSHVWTDVDPDRTGILPFVFEDGMGFERWVDYLLDVPMYFIFRDDAYIDCAGMSFRDFLDGRLPARPGETPHMGDWANHVTVNFPEVRLKQFLEMRGADGGSWHRLCALPALWTGLLYDQSALDAAWDLCKGWSHQQHAFLRADVPVRALATPLEASMRAGSTMRELAGRVLEIAEAGLKNRARLDEDGQDETHYLATLGEIVERGRTQAEEMLDAYETRWDGSVDPAYREYSY